jgi:hypothetical protein
MRQTLYRLFVVSLIMHRASFALGADDRVSGVALVPVPEGGRPVVARTFVDGTVHLLYEGAGGPRYARSTDGGRTFGVTIAVLDRPSPVAGLEYSCADMAVGREGRVHVALSTNAWKLKRPAEEWGFFYARLDPGASAFSPVENLNHRPSEGFSLAADPRGNVTACWLADRLYANVSHDDGKTFAPAVEIDRTYNPCNCCTTSAVYGADGRLAVLYREETGNERDMFLVLWDQERGRASRTRVSTTSWKVDACPMTYYTISREGEGYLAVWPTRGRIYFTRLDGDGAATLLPEVATRGNAGMRTGMLVLRAPDGRMLIAWKKDSRLGWQEYDASGRASGATGFAESPGNGAAGFVSPAGQFVLFR